MNRKMATYLRFGPVVALLAIMLAVLLPFAGQPRPAEAVVTNVVATAGNRVINATSVYTVSWTTSLDYAVGFTAIIDFPAGVVTPATVTAANTRAGFGTGATVAAARAAAIAALAVANAAGGVAVGGDGNAVTVTTAVIDPPVPNLDAIAGNADDIVAVAVQFVAGALITNPAVAGVAGPVTVTPDPDGAGAVAAEAAVASADIVYVRLGNVTVASDPNDPNDPAEYTVTFIAGEDLAANVAKIFLIMDKDIQVPATIDKSRVTIQATAVTNPRARIAQPAEEIPSPNQVVNPAQDVVIRRVGPDSKDFELGITVPDMDPSATTAKAGIQEGILAGATVTIRISQASGIKNPIEGDGDRIVVTTNLPGAFDRDQGATAISIAGALRTAATAAEVLFRLETPFIVELSSKDGSRGAKLTIIGRGFKDGTTATVWLDDGDLVREPATETDLGTAPVGADSRFTLTITVANPPFRPGRVNLIAAQDGREQRVSAGRAPVFGLLGSVTASPKNVSLGDRITIELKDFDAACDVAGVAICAGFAFAPRINLGGVLLERLRFTGTTLINAQGDATFTAVVPNGVPLGTQAIEVRFACCGGVPETRRFSLTVGGANITLTPETVLPNQTLSIIGNNFTSSDLTVACAAPPVQPCGPATMVSMTIEGVAIPDVKISDSRGVGDIRIDGGGNWSTSLVVPVTNNTTTPGTYEIKVTDNYRREGVARITIPPRTLKISPAEGRVGTTVTITGTGYPINNTKTGAATTTVTVEYRPVGAGITTISIQADASGIIQGSLTVPTGTSIPSTNTVQATYTTEPPPLAAVGTNVVTTVTHRVPRAEVKLDQTQGPAGTRVNLSGLGFRAFVTVDRIRFGELEVTPSPRPPTGTAGDFKADFLVPQTEIGVQTVEVQAGGTTASTSFIVTTGPVAPPALVAAATVAPAAALAPLGANLVRVWGYDAPTQKFQLYDPAAALLSDLSALKRGAGYWINVKSAQTVTLGTFEYNLSAGWNNVGWQG